MINIVASSRYKIDRKFIKKTISEILINFDIPSNAILNIAFVGRKKMKTIAAKYKRENIALPVLSFSYLEQKTSLPSTPEVKESSKKTSGVDNIFGEILICYPQAVLLAAEKQKKVDNIILFLLKHGIENILK